MLLSFVMQSSVVCVNGLGLALNVSIVVTYEIRVFFEGAQKEVFSSIF
jgi:hypothetical protein